MKYYNCKFHGIPYKYYIQYLYFLCVNVNYKLDGLISNIYIILLEVLMKILINLVTSICLITLIALFEYNKINSIIFVVLSILCLILNFSLKKMKNTDM